MMGKKGQAMGPVVYVRFLLGNLKSCNVYIFSCTHCIHILCLCILVDM